MTLTNQNLIKNMLRLHFIQGTLTAVWFIIFIIPVSIKDLNIKRKPQYNVANNFANLWLLHSGKNWWKVQDNGNVVPTGFPAF